MLKNKKNNLIIVGTLIWISIFTFIIISYCTTQNLLKSKYIKLNKIPKRAYTLQIDK